MDISQSNLPHDLLPSSSFIVQLCFVVALLLSLMVVLVILCLIDYCLCRFLNMTQQVVVQNHEPWSYMDSSIEIMHEMELGVLDDDHIHHRQPIKNIFKVAMEASSRRDHLVSEI